METLTFAYVLVYSSGVPDTEPIAATEKPRNLIAFAEPGGPTQAVVWDYPTRTWNFRPDIARTYLYLKPEEKRTRRVDRATAGRAALSIATKPLPTEAELTAICRAARPG